MMHQCSNSSAKEVLRGRQQKRIGRQQLQSSTGSAAATAAAVAAGGGSGVARSGSGSRAVGADGRLGTAAGCDDVLGYGRGAGNEGQQDHVLERTRRRNRAKRGTTTHNVVLQGSARVRHAKDVFNTYEE